MKKPKSGYVYVASVVGDPTICKVGYTTKTPEERVKYLYRDYKGLEFELFRSFRFDRPAVHESMSHGILHESRLDRELFNVTPNEGCLAIERTIGKSFSLITETEDEFKESINQTWDGLGSNKARSCYNYITVNLELSFDSDFSYSDFKFLVNTYMEKFNIRSPHDIDADLLVSLHDEIEIQGVSNGD